MHTILIAALLSAPNVVFLSVDTLRADHLGCYGYAQATSPHIDQLAQEGLLFEDCVCEVPLTAPSFGSMLTSRLPRQTGTTRNGLRMPADVPMVAEIFKQAGYQTFCVQSNWTLKTKLFSINRGFDVYEDDFHQKRWGVIKPERYADEVTKIALEQLDRRDPDRPFFCWVHYSDPHAPYKFHPLHAPSGVPAMHKGKRDKVVCKYDSEIAYTDHHIAKLLEALPKEDTYILFTADHGESLYEHDYLGHGRRIYQPGMHIPFIITGPGIEPRRSKAPVRGVDIGPTLLGLANLKPARGMLGMDVRHGSPAMTRPRIVETYGGAVPKLPGAKALMAERPPQRRGIYLEGWKLILDERNRPELFHLTDDSMEAKNVAGAMPDRVDKMHKQVDAWDTQFDRNNAVDADLNEDDFEALKSLGYLE